VFHALARIFSTSVNALVSFGHIVNYEAEVAESASLEIEARTEVVGNFSPRTDEFGRFVL